jgi:predicted DNA-binding transcriptional regulator YafY
MYLMDRIERVKELDRLIRNETTGSPEQIANRLHVSRRQFFYLLDEMKFGGADIRYDPIRCTYQYLNDFKLF